MTRIAILDDWQNVARASAVAELEGVREKLGTPGASARVAGMMRLLLEDA